jgi:hypothetical protein
MKINLSLANKGNAFFVRKNVKIDHNRSEQVCLSGFLSPLFILTLILSIFAFMPQMVQAGPPFVTDDPETVAYQHWEIYLAAQFKHDRDQDSSTLPHLEINYGAIPNVQIHLIAPLVYVKPEGGSSQYGYGDTELGVKFRFIQETDYLPQVGIFPMVELTTGDAGKGLGNSRTQYFLPIWLQKSFGPWTTYGGGGYCINPGEGNKDWWQFGWQLSREINKHLTLGAELYYKAADTNDSNDTTGYSVGTIINITENHHILLSAGQDINGPNYLSIYVGYQFTFGPYGFGPPKKVSGT